MNALQKFYYRWWRPAIFIVSLALIAYLLYFHRLSTLLPGYSASEIAAYHSASDWHLIIQNPTNAPFKIIVWLLTALWHHHILMTRIISAGFGVAAVIFFFTLLRHWYDFRISFLSTVLFATSAVFLHNARLGNGYISQMSILVFISSVMWYRRQKNRRVSTSYFLAALFAVLAYIPGIIWFELFAAIVLYKDLKLHLLQTPRKHLAGGAITFLALITPLIIASFKRPKVIISISSLPSNLEQFTATGSHIVQTILALGIRSPSDPLLWVGHAPLLSITGLILAILGAYDYFSEERLARAIFWAGCIVLSIILISFSNTVSYALMVPLVYLFIAAGLDRLLDQWLKVFPRNPIARFTGVALLCIMLFFSVVYQVRAYFVAWPYSKATEHRFNLPAPQ